MKKVSLSVSCLLIVDNTFLIVKRSPFDNFLPNIWEFPGGQVENNESVLNALIREIKEEIQLDIEGKEVDLIGISEENDKNRSIQFNYEIRFSHKPPIVLSSEHTCFDWADQNDPRLDKFLKNILMQSRILKDIKNK